MELIEPTWDIAMGPDGDLAVHRETHFDADFLDTLQSERHAKAALRAGELSRAASVPTHVIDIWMNQGFDFYRASAREIVGKLRAESLDYFITTPKAV